MDREELKKDPYVTQWLNHYGEGSRKVYFLEFAAWCEYIDMPPREQIQKRMQDLQSTNPKERAFFEDKMKEYVQGLVTKDYTEKTIHSKHTPIQSFFAYHRVNLHFRRGELRVKKPKGGLIEKYCLGNEEIRACLEIANPRDSALMLFMYHTGFSPVDVEFFNIEHIKTIYEPIENHYYIAKERQKTRSPHVTCISVEALEAIQLMLKERGNPKEGPLFVSYREQRLGTRFINDALKKVVKTALPKERSEPFQAKSLRDSYEIALLRADIKQELKDLLFGHIRSGAKKDYAFNELVIRETYAKVFKHLSVNGRRTTNKAIKALQEDMEELRTTTIGQAKTIAKLQEETQEQRESIIHYSDQLDKMLRLMDDPNKELLYDEIKDGKLTGKTFRIVSIPLTKKEMKELEEAEKNQEE